MFDRTLPAVVRCPICGLLFRGVEDADVDYRKLQGHLRAHGVHYPATMPPEVCVCWAPCGAAFQTEEARLAHIVEHGKECIILNWMAQI